MVTAANWNELANDLIWLRGPGNVLTGVIGSTGTITAGTGFTCSRSSTGIYVITYTNSISSARVLAVPFGAAAALTVNVSSSVSASCTIELLNAASTHVDCNFFFEVREVV